MNLIYMGTKTGYFSNEMKRGRGREPSVKFLPFVFLKFCLSTISDNLLPKLCLKYPCEIVGNEVKYSMQICNSPVALSPLKS